MCYSELRSLDLLVQILLLLVVTAFASGFVRLIPNFLKRLQLKVAGETCCPLPVSYLGSDLVVCRLLCVYECMCYTGEKVCV